jgi:cytochrome c-type biogenesis protein CcmH/NrfF
MEAQKEVQLGPSQAKVPPMSEGVSPEVARKSASIAKQTMSPFCPGRTLADCPSPNAAEWRRDIELMVAEGRDPSEIQEVLSQRAALDLSGSPQKDASYAVPVVLLLAALLLLGFIFFRLRRGKAEKPLGDGPGVPKEDPGPDLDDRLAEELDRVT